LQERRDALKNSGIGKMVMFLYKLPDETPANRKMAKQIVERWSRPIFDSHRDPRCYSSKQHVLTLKESGTSTRGRQSPEMQRVLIIAAMAGTRNARRSALRRYGVTSGVVRKLHCLLSMRMLRTGR
jgi:hypothetical protein